MRKNLIKPLMGILLLAVTGCGTGMLRVESQPESSDVLLSISGQPPRKVGVTPFVMTESALGVKNESFQLLLSKDGYQSQGVVIPATALSRETTIQVRLTEISAPKKEMVQEQLQRVASGVAEVQTLLRAKQFDDVDRRLSGLLNEFPSVATFHELQGTSHYLRKDLQRALVSYQKAAELNPSNPSVVRMIDKLKSFRLPAGGAL